MLHDNDTRLLCGLITGLALLRQSPLAPFLGLISVFSVVDF